jgi:copper chaperone CopZ
MKKFLIAVLVFVSVATHAQISKATLTASGLTCSMCSRAIYKSLEKVSFIDQVKANIKESSYDITFKQGDDIDLDALRKAVEGAGFSVAKLQITATFNNAEIQNDVMLKVNGKNLHFLNVSEQTLSGEKVLTLVDEHFTTNKEHKKYARYTTMKCFHTGMLEACCKVGNTGERIYHVTI